MKQLVQHCLLLTSLLFAHNLRAQCVLPLSESHSSNTEVLGTYTGQSFISDCIATIEQITVTSGAAADIPNVTLRVWEETLTGTSIKFIQNNITINGLNVPTQIDLTTLVTPKPVIISPGIQNVVKYYFTLESNNSIDLKLKAYDDAVNFQLLVGTAITTSALTTYSGTTDLIFQITTSSAVLPIQYIALKGFKTDDKVLIQWETEGERNNKLFEVERRTVNNDFAPIGIVYSASAAYKVATKSYQYMDERPAKGVNYYRLKQVDLDGKFEYSKTITINNASKQGLAVYPNPVKNRLTLQTDNDAIANIKIYHINGQLIYAQKTAGANNTNIEVSNLTNGVYFVYATLNNETVVNKFVKN